MIIYQFDFISPTDTQKTMPSKYISCHPAKLMLIWKGCPWFSIFWLTGESVTVSWHVPMRMSKEHQAADAQFEYLATKSANGFKMSEVHKRAEKFMAG